MDKETFDKFINEIKNILLLQNITTIGVYQFDTRTLSYDEVTNMNELHDIKFISGGGTCIKDTLKKAAKSVGEKSVEKIQVKHILKVTGYIRGGCSPIGMKKQYPTVFHESCLNNPNIIVSAGKIGYQIDLDPQTLIEFTKGKCADIIK